jgi:adenylate cyclase
MTDGHYPVVALNADVVGYSRLMADDLEATTKAMEQHRRLVEGQVSAVTGGNLVNFVGDNFMAIFDDAPTALRAAIAIATEVETRNSEISESRQVRFRMGLDLGDVMATDGQYFGDVLNIASRIQAVAPAGGICVSGAVYHAMDEPALRFRALGRQRLKNIPEEIAVYEFVGLPADRTPGSGRTSLSLEFPTISVLPIHAEMVDESVRATAAVVRGDMMHRLTAVPQLRVIDASATPGDGTVRHAARYTIESGVHQAGDKVRIYASIFDVTTMNVVKSHKWTVDAGDLFNLSEEIADEVARSVEVELIVGAPAGLYAELDDPIAIEKIYLGWYHLTAATQEGWVKALELFGEVAESHPDKPYGSVLSAFANWSGASNGWASDPEATLETALLQARSANELGDPTGMARTVEAAVLMSQGKGSEAVSLMEQVEILRPTCDVTFGLEGSVRRYMGDWEKAVDLVDVAMRLTGVNKPWYPTVKACSLFMGGRADSAATVAEMVLDYQPNNLEALLVLIAAQVELGLERRAKANAEILKERFPSVDPAAWLDGNPYQDKVRVERWKENLVVAGAV